MTESWRIDELAHAGPEHLDAAFVAGYDRKQGYPDPAEDLASFEARGLDGTSAVVDLGAGSGQFALAAARRFGRVTEFSTYRWLLEPMLAATGFEIVSADFAGRLYGAYTCIRS